jgi:hypothetical protein
MKVTKIICAGFGGQGVMSMGRLIAYTGMLEGQEVSWLPSYGPEMRGGTANCSVIVSDHPIGSPVISRDANAAIVMNLPSMRKFDTELVDGGPERWAWLRSHFLFWNSRSPDRSRLRLPQRRRPMCFVRFSVPPNAALWFRTWWGTPPEFDRSPRRTD